MPERGFATETWDSDEWFQELSRDQRYLFIYLWTNNHCNQAALYHITLTTIAFEAKVPKEELPELLNSLSPKVIWYPTENLIWVKNFIKRQSKSSKFLNHPVAEAVLPDTFMLRGRPPRIIINTRIKLRKGKAGKLTPEPLEPVDVIFVCLPPL